MPWPGRRPHQPLEKDRLLITAQVKVSPLVEREMCVRNRVEPMVPFEVDVLSFEGSVTPLAAAGETSHDARLIGKPDGDVPTVLET